MTRKVIGIILLKFPLFISTTPSGLIFEAKFQEEFSCSLHNSAALTLAKNSQSPLESELGGNRIRSGRAGKENTYLSGNATAVVEILFIRIVNFEKLTFP
jgi:hypothetical protein